MNKLIKTFIAGLLVIASVNAMAIGPIGSHIWRDDRSSEGQGIAWEYLNDQVIYAKISKISDADSDSVFDNLCSQEKLVAWRGNRLFDVDDPNICSNRNNLENYSVYSFRPVSRKMTWNYYFIVLPTNPELKDTIVKIQMGSTVTRVPPHILQIMLNNGEETESCKNTRATWQGTSIVCDGWTYESLMQYWGKDVPLVIKALNGSGVKSQ